MLLPESGVSRSWTRFLLPLTDVMIILFSMFLLMPHLEERPPTSAPDGPRPGWQLTRSQETQEQLERYRQLESQPLSERSLVRVLNIDFHTGALLWPGDEGPVKLTVENFPPFVAKDLQRAQELRKELFYMVLRPLPNERGFESSRPLDEDLRNYEAMFNAVRHRFHPSRVSYQVVYPRRGE